MVICHSCGMGYVIGLPEDEKEHGTYHDQVIHGVSSRPLKTDVTLWTCDADRITVVTAFSPFVQRRRAGRAARIANRDMSYDFGIYSEHEHPDERNIHLFLYHKQNRIVGLIVLERRDRIWRCSWEDYKKGQAEELIGHPPIWSIGFVWVHGKHRMQGLARQLFQTTIGHLSIKGDLLGFYTPFSENGEEFVRRLYPEQFLIAK